MECSFKECDLPSRARGLCRAHYEQKYRKKTKLKPIRYRSKSGSYDGPGWLDKNGYRWLYRPGHPNANGQGQIQEHRLVVAEHLGRPLRSEETVHHRKDPRDDNRLENLELWASRHPKGQRVEDLIEHAMETLMLYAPDRVR
jgi:hypothetical protein